MVSRIGSDGTRQPSPENSYQPSGKDAHCSDGRDPRSRARRVDRDDARRVVWDATQQSPVRYGRLLRGIVGSLRSGARLQPRRTQADTEFGPRDPAEASRPSSSQAPWGSQTTQQEWHVKMEKLATECSRRQLTRPGTGSHRFWLVLLDRAELSSRDSCAATSSWSSCARPRYDGLVRSVHHRLPGPGSSRACRVERIHDRHRRSTPR